MFSFRKCLNWFMDCTGSYLGTLAFDHIDSDFNFNVYGDYKDESFDGQFAVHCLKESIDLVAEYAPFCFEFLSTDLKKVYVVTSKTPTFKYVVELSRYSNTLYLSLTSIKLNYDGISSKLLACLLIEEITRSSSIIKIKNRLANLEDYKQSTIEARELAESIAIKLEIYEELYMFRSTQSGLLFAMQRQ